MRKSAFLLLITLCLMALPCTASAQGDGSAFERIYNMTPREFKNELFRYESHNMTDSAMMLANIKANKYGRMKLSKDEYTICCDAYRYMGIVYMMEYYDYKRAAENYLQAQQIAEKYDLTHQQIVISSDLAILTATRNNLENNFAFSNEALEGFKKSFNQTLSLVKSKPSYGTYDMTVLECTLSNLLSIALNYDKTREVDAEIAAYRSLMVNHDFNSNTAMVMCNTIDCYNASNFDKALTELSTPLTRDRHFVDNDFVGVKVLVDLARYFVLKKKGDAGEALKVLQQQERFLRENNMTFELLEVLQLLKQHYRDNGNEAMAGKYEVLYYTTKDEFISKSQLGKMDQVKLNYELEQARQRIREMSYRQRIQKMIMWGIVIFALIAIGVLFAIMINYRKTRKRDRLFYEKNIALLRAEEEKKMRQTNRRREIIPEQNALLERIINVMETSSEVFDADFSVNRLADMVESNRTYVSQVINDNLQCNFTTLLNGYRIKEACRRLLDNENYGNVTIEGIANSVGFKSRSNFVTVFKNITGLTPSAFLKMSQQEQNVNTI